MKKNKKCILCKKVLVGNKKIPICQSCRDKAGEAASNVGEVCLGVVGGVATVVLSTGKDKVIDVVDKLINKK